DHLRKLRVSAARGRRASLTRYCGAKGGEYKFEPQFRPRNHRRSGFACSSHGQRWTTMKIDHNTVAVVTGAASGIGRALAVRLAQEGASLAIADIKAPALDETAQMLRPAGGAPRQSHQAGDECSGTEPGAAF